VEAETVKHFGSVHFHTDLQFVLARAGPKIRRNDVLARAEVFQQNMLVQPTLKQHRLF
jgi:hypothetical protein